MDDDGGAFIFVTADGFGWWLEVGERSGVLEEVLTPMLEGLEEDG